MSMEVMLGPIIRVGPRTDQAHRKPATTATIALVDGVDTVTHVAGKKDQYKINGLVGFYVLSNRYWEYAREQPMTKIILFHRLIGGRVRAVSIPTSSILFTTAEGLYDVCWALTTPEEFDAYLQIAV